MPSQDLLDNLITHLEAQRSAGVEWIRISAENRGFLSELLSRPTARTAQTSAARQPTSRPPSHRTPASPEAPAYNSPSNSDTSTAPAELDLSGAGWDTLREMVPRCRRCQLCGLGRSQTVFGAGNENTDLMFIGDGPVADDDREGVPFVGEAGQLLTKIIQAMGFTRDEIYIANIVKCCPPQNRNPEPLEATACLPYLIRQIELVQPKVLVLLGAVPLQALLNIQGMTRNRGRWLKFRDIDVMPTSHPAYLQRKPEAKREVWEDMKQVMAKFGKMPPAANTEKS